MALFDDATVKSKISEPSLRAAFVGLTGTSLEPAINEFMTDPRFTTISFGQIAALTPISQTQPSGSAARIVVSQRYQAEPFQLLVTPLGHELQHTDQRASPADEAITNGEAAIEYTELLAEHPEMAYLNTELARRLNDYSMMLLEFSAPRLGAGFLYSVRRLRSLSREHDPHGERHLDLFPRYGKFCCTR